jgi:hypothetical protein
MGENIYKLLYRGGHNNLVFIISTKNFGRGLKTGTSLKRFCVILEAISVDAIILGLQQKILIAIYSSLLITSNDTLIKRDWYK